MEETKKEELTNLKLKIGYRQCDQCLFSRNRIVSLTRKKEILQDCIAADSHFECHKGTMIGEKIVCRGFYDRMTSKLIRIAKQMDFIEFVDPFELMLKNKKSHSYFTKNGFNAD